MCNTELVHNQWISPREIYRNLQILRHLLCCSFFSMLRYLVFFIRTVQQLQGQCRYVTKIYCSLSPKNLRHCSKPDRSKIQCILLLLDVPLLKGVWKINFMPDLKHPNAWVNSLPGIINIHGLILPRTGSESKFLSRQKVLGLVERSVQVESVKLSPLSQWFVRSRQRCRTHPPGTRGTLQ